MLHASARRSARSPSPSPRADANDAHGRGPRAPPSLTWRDRARRVDPRYLIAFLITLVLVVAQLRYHVIGGYDRLAVALLTCVATEALLSWFDRGKVVNLQSAYISGISLTLLLKPQGRGALAVRVRRRSSRSRRSTCCATGTITSGTRRTSRS